jgi:hypothetical protein
MGVDLKQGPVLAALLMVVLLSGCGPAATLAPSPTLDRPSLSEREAIAVVKSHLARVSTRGRNCLSLIQYMGNEGTWTAEYLGTGEWRVSATELFFAGTHSWRVFEASHSVVRESNGEGNDLLSLQGC